MNENLENFNLSDQNENQEKSMSTEWAEEKKINENLEEKRSKEILEKRPEEWMIRPCDAYKEEYKDCTCFKSRFNQYFIFGEYIDCTQWKTDYENCKQWKSKKDEKAFNELVTSETNRRMKRFKAHYANDIWKKRDKPPEDWNKPLPNWLLERDKNSYLDHKSRALKSGEIQGRRAKGNVKTRENN